MIAGAWHWHGESDPSRWKVSACFWSPNVTCPWNVETLGVSTPGIEGKCRNFTGITPTRRSAATSPLKGEVEFYHPPPPPPPPPPPEEPPEKPEEDEELDGGGVGMVEAIVEAIDEEKPPMRSPKLP